MAETEVNWLSKDEQKAWRIYLYATARLQDALNQALEQEPSLKLSMPEYEILVRLSEAKDHRLRMSELAGSVVNSRSRLTHTVARLEKRGLVSKERCVDDGRGRYAALTNSGLKLLQMAAPIHVKSVRDNFFDIVGREKFLQLGQLLSTLLSDEELKTLDAQF